PAQFQLSDRWAFVRAGFARYALCDQADRLAGLAHAARTAISQPDARFGLGNRIEGRFGDHGETMPVNRGEGKATWATGLRN
ncbi:MAG: hypothetical protein AAFQ85_10870, partial [Pseudomonadota bacterium]